MISFPKSELTIKGLMPFTDLTFHLRELLSSQAKGKSNLVIGELEERHIASDFSLAISVLASKMSFIHRPINGSKKINFTLDWISLTYPT